MRIQYILHASFELPGVIRDWANQNQFSEKFCRPFAGEETPDPAEFDFLIVMGGPQSALKVDEIPYLQQEVALIQQALKRNVPVLGFCLGAQLLGVALGAKAEQSP